MNFVECAEAVPAKKASIKKGSMKEVPGDEKKGSKKGSQIEVPAELIPEAPAEPVPEPVDPNRPVLTELPKLKVVHFYDPDTGDDVMTREDLVVVIKSETKKSTFVQHADGTQMYSEIAETYPSPEHVLSQGELMMAQIHEVFPANPPRVKDEPEPPKGECPPEGAEGEDGEKRGSVAGEAGKKGSIAGGEKKGSIAGGDKKASLTEKKGSLAEIKTSLTGGEKKGSLTEGEKKVEERECKICDPLGLKIRRSLLPEPPPIPPEVTTTWHVHKDGLAKVQGKVSILLELLIYQMH